MPAPKKSAAKKKPATKRPPEPEIQVDRGQAQTPNEVRYKNQGLKPVEAVPPYEPKRVELENAGFDHHAAEKHRQAELQYERDVHNDRTGDASLSKGTWS